MKHFFIKVLEYVATSWDYCDFVVFAKWNEVLYSYV